MRASEQPLRRIACALLLAGSAAYAGEEVESDGPEVTLTATLASDYVWRGLSLSQRRPSLQLDAAVTQPLARGVTVEAGAWAYSTRYEAYPDVHLDSGVYVRLDAPAGCEACTWGVQAGHYVFPQARDWNYTEYTVSFARAAGDDPGSVGVELAYTHAPDAFGTGSRGRYFEVGGTVRLPHATDLRWHLGRSLYDRPDLAYPAFSDIKLALARSWHGFDLEAGWVATRGGDLGRMGRPRLVATVAHSF